MKMMMRCLVIVLFVGTISTQLIAQWVRPGMSGRIVLSIVVINGDLYAGAMNGEGMFVSTDLGRSWTARSNGLPKDQKYPLRFSEIYDLVYMDSILYAGTWDGVYSSTNKGKNWSPSLANSSYTFVVSGNKLYSGGESGICWTTDNGKQWSKISYDYPAGWIFAKDSLLYAWTYRGNLLYVTSDDGAHWTAASAGLAVDKINEIVCKGDDLFAPTNHGIFRSTNRGVNWFAASEGLPRVLNNTQFSEIASIAVSGKNLFAASTGRGIFISTNSGANWSFAGNGLPSGRYTNVVQILTLVPDGSSLFAGTVEYGIFLSTDNGANWGPINADIPLSTHVSAFAASAFPDGTLRTNLFAGTEGRGVFHTIDDGVHWTPVNSGLTDYNIRALQTSGKNLYAGTRNGIYCTVNNGMSWTHVSTGLRADTINALGVSDSNLFAGTDRGLYISTNNGASWVVTALDTFIVTSIAAVSGGSSVFAGTDKGVYLSTDNGMKWAYAGLNDVTAIAALPNATEGISIVAGVRVFLHDTLDEYPRTVGELCLSTDNGASWTIIDSNGALVGSLTASGNSLFALTGAGARLSADFGSNWTAIDSGLTKVHAMVITPVSGETRATYLYAGTADRVMRRPLTLKRTEVGTSSARYPEIHYLSQNYPNPFNPSTTLRYSVPERSTVRLSIFNTLGQKVSEMVNETKDAGLYEQSFNASQLSSGIYFYRIEATSVNNSMTFVETKKMVLMR